MSTSVSSLCPSWTENSRNQTPCQVLQEVDNACTYTYITISPPSAEWVFIPGGSNSNATACTCSWASYNLLSACMFCASSSPLLVSWSEWTANCPANLTSTSTYFPSYAGVTLPSNTTIPCYAGYDPRSWPNGTFNETTASSIAATSSLDLTGAAGSCTSSSSSSSSATTSYKTPVGAIVGGVIGGIFLLLLLCCCVAFAIRRRRRRRRTPESSPETALGGVNGSAKEADLVAPRVSLSQSSSPIDSIAEKHPVMSTAPVLVVDGPLQLPTAQAVPSSDSGGVAIAREHTIGDIGTGAGARGASMEAGCGELVGERVEAPLRLLPSPSTNPGIVGVVREHTGSDYEGIIPIRGAGTGAAPPEADHVGNILTQLYIEDSRSTDVVHDPGPSQATNLLTVSRAEAEAVQALLDSEARNKMITPSGYGVPRSSSLSVEAKKGPVSEDVVKRVVYTYLMDPAAKQNVPPSRIGGIKLDLLFIQDLTASQQPYIDNVKASINTICSEIWGSDYMKSSRPGDLRVAFIGFRDHPPQDYSFVTRDWDFTSDITQIHANLGSLPGAEGGGDGPEAVTAALDRALRMRWRDDCNKVAVLISDAPPHGIGSQGDHWPDGVPGVPDPLDLAREMLKKKITLHFIACEPSLSHYENAQDFYRGLTRITTGITIPLLDARVMVTCIIGSALESLAIQDLINEYSETLRELVASREPSLVVKYLHALMRVRGRTADQLIMNNIYATSGNSHENVEIWSSARSLADAKARLT